MVFYVMYLVVEVPSNLLLKRTGSIWLAFLTIGFGATCLATGFIENKAGLYVVRVSRASLLRQLHHSKPLHCVDTQAAFSPQFLLGTLEGGLLPGKDDEADVSSSMMSVTY